MGLHMGPVELGMNPLVHRPSSWDDGKAAQLLGARPRKAILQGGDPPRPQAVVRDAGGDLDGGAAEGLLRPAAPSSPIAHERAGPGAPSPGFLLAAILLAAATLAVGIFLAARGPAALPVEQEAASLAGWGSLDVRAARYVAVGAQAALVGAVAMAGRRLAHSETAGLLAAALVAADPSGLLVGSLGVPQAVGAAGLLWALALATSPVPLFHWLAGLALAVATLALPTAAVWILPLALILLLRGHIYAAPQHLGLGLAQVAVLPLAALALRLVLEGVGAVPACLTPSLLDALTLRALAAPGPDLLVVPNPVTWMAGAGALASLGLGGLAVAIGRFRVARAPGRLQLRVVSPFPPILARGLWLLLLALLAPPAAWLPLFALALAMGVRELGEDAPGFGLALALVLLVFAGLVLVRAWGAVHGSPGGAADALDLVPWARSVPC